MRGRQCVWGEGYVRGGSVGDSVCVRGGKREDGG